MKILIFLSTYLCYALVFTIIKLKPWKQKYTDNPLRGWMGTIFFPFVPLMYFRYAMSHETNKMQAMAEIFLFWFGCIITTHLIADS